MLLNLKSKNLHFKDKNNIFLIKPFFFYLNY